MTLPLCDQVLLALQASPRSARQLSDELGKDVAAIHAILRALRAQGALEERPQARAASLWALAPGVRLTLQPARLLVEGALPPPTPARANRCRAVITRGTQCCLRAARGDLCVFHGSHLAKAGGDRVGP